jgi:phosphoribosylformylglycinamidine synthase subunit PurL
VPVRRLGVIGGDALEIENVLSIPLSELRQAHQVTLPNYMG